MTAVATENRISSPPPAPSPSPRRSEWAPRIWEGSDFFFWIRYLARNRFAVQPSHWYIAVIVTIVSFCHTLGRLLQEIILGRKVRKTAIKHPPLFIIGHWRTGTTLLHEFLILDDRHTYPTTYECLEPNHFLLTEDLFSRVFRFLIPSTRPMDNMKAGFDRPQEDEFALCMMGAPSPYLTIGFPNRPPQCQEYFDLDKLSPRALRSWKQKFKLLLQCITFKRPRRLILKSPPHTFRIKVLQELFPGALFVHIVRDPYVVFPSTVNLWRTMYNKHGLQKPNFSGLEELVFRTFTHMYDRLEETRHLVDPARFLEIRYEDLVRDPIGCMRNLYDHFHLEGFDKVLPSLEKYLAANKGYETNRYQISPQQQIEITRRWGKVIDRYGYQRREPEAQERE